MLASVTISARCLQFRRIERQASPRFKNQPPRKHFWAEDLTIKHELFHTAEDVKFGREGATLGQDWLNRQTARNFDDVGVLLGKVSQIVAGRILAAMAPPGVEQRAYDDGAADYRARARAIKTKGDARGYVPKPPCSPGAEFPAGRNPQSTEHAIGSGPP